MELHNYISFLFASVMLILIPGPTNLVVLTTGINHGFYRSVWTVIGAAVSHACLLLVASVGLSAILTTSAWAFECVRWMGVTYLIWLGINQWRQPKTHDDANDATTSSSNVQHFLRGFLTNTTNPKALLFYGAFFPPFINPNESFPAQFALLGITFLIIFALIASAHGLIGARLHHLPGRKFQTWQRRVSGSFLIGSGVLLAAAKRE